MSAHAFADEWPGARHRARKHHAKKAIGAAVIAAMASKGRGEEGRRGERGRHRHRDRFFFGPGFGGPFMAGFGDPRFGPGGPRRGPKARRGDVRTALLLLLAEEPRNGYQLMQEIEERSDGVWRPSPGSIYPALQQLEDEGLVRAVETDGRKLFELTDAGRQFVADRDEELPAPWDEMSGEVSDEHAQAAMIMRGLVMAFSQVMQAGNDAQMAEATKALAETRRRLYGILAEDEPVEGDE
jgi:DNA-binding PadR family transcriptional regulator